MGRECWSTRGVVEQCLFFPIEAFARWGTLSNPPATASTFSWTNSRSEAELGRLEYVVRRDENGLVIHVRRQFARLYGAAKLIEECTIPITTTACRFGGERFWFRCPFIREGKICGRRVGRLYLPPGQALFGCRTCHNLIHRSAREHDSRKDELIRDPVALAAALGDKKLARRLLALGALVRLPQRQQKRIAGT